jgi:hypothetical protein
LTLLLGKTDLTKVRPRLGIFGTGRMGRVHLEPPLLHHPDFYARVAAAYEAELAEFATRVGAGVPLEPGLDAGWKTLLVANVAEASSRQAGRVFELAQPDGGAIESAADAAAFALASGVV